MDDYHKLIADRVVHHAEKLGHHIDYIEVGTLTGNSAEAVLSTHKVKQAILIDNFSLEYNGKPQTKDMVELRLLPYKGLFEIIVGDSRVVLPRITRSFDIGFVDGDHSKETCRKDLRNMFPLIRLNGVMFVHDTNSSDHADVVIEVTRFAAQHGLDIIFHDHVANGLAEIRRP